MNTLILNANESLVKDAVSGLWGWKIGETLMKGMDETTCVKLLKKANVDAITIRQHFPMVGFHS